MTDPHTCGIMEVYMKNGTTTTELSNGYRFRDGESVNAILDPNGKLSLRDGNAGLDIYQSWRDYVKEVLSDVPTKGGEDEILEQLSVILGTPEPIDVQVKQHSVPQQGDSDMKNATAAPAKKATAKAAPPAKAPRVKAEKVMGPCVCGCGGLTGGNFVPGHDSRVHSWQKKVAKGEIKLNSLPATAQKYIKEHA